MKNKIRKLTEKIINGYNIKQKEAKELMQIDCNDIDLLNELFNGANKIRDHFVGNKVELCSIINAKSGSCSEDCKFCSQSAHYNTEVEQYDLLSYDKILERAKEMEKEGVNRFSLVTSGKGISDNDLEKVINIYKNLKKDTNLRLCASHGIISYEQAKKLKDAGVDRYHHNVETESSYYSSICTTHSYKDRLETIKKVEEAGLKVCCGGIIGLGEGLKERVEMFFELKKLDIRSIPINILSPIEGTPLSDNEVLKPYEILKTFAVCRYVIPPAYIRYAGGRIALNDKQTIGLKAGVNAMLAGNYLTTSGSNIENDKRMIRSNNLSILD